VIQLSNMLLYNEKGRIDANKPFFPLGNPTLKDAYFIFGSEEWLNKSISQISIQFTWKNVPNNFSSYYEVYNWYLGDQSSYFKNQSFIVIFSKLIKDTWEPLVARPFELFEENEEDNSVRLVSTLNLKLDQDLFFPGSADKRDAFDDFGKAKGGFIKMQLVGPAHGFGSSIYPEVVAAVVEHNTKLIPKGNREGDFIPPPNKPYSPLTEKIDIGIN